MGHPTEGPCERLAVGVDQAAGQGGGAGQGDLLAEHGPHGQLVAVDGARHPPPRHGRHQRAEQGVGAECLDHRQRIGVEVEQGPAALHGGGQVAQVVQPEAGQDMAVARA